MLNTILFVHENKYHDLPEFFKEFDCVLYTASSVEEAKQTFFANDISLLLISPKLGAQLCPIIRKSSEQLPIVVVTEEESNYERVHCKIMRASGYIKYSPSEDFVEYLGNIVAFIEKQSQREKRQISIAGNLSVIPLSENLQNLNHYRKTGCVKLQVGALRGKVYVKNGDCVHAEISSYYSGIHALYNMMYWESGSFQFLEEEISSQKSIRQDFTGVLLEWCRLDDEINRLPNKQHFSSMDLQFVRDCIFSASVTEQDLKASLEKMNHGDKIAEILCNDQHLNEEQTDKFYQRLSAIARQKTLCTELDDDSGQHLTLNFDIDNVELQLQDVILQILASRLSLMSMQQMNECLQEKSSSFKNKSLCDVVVERGYLTKEVMDLLTHLKDEDGESLLFDYEVLHKIGEGEKSIVYKAIKVSENRSVAIKIFMPGIEESSRNTLRFIYEADISSRLQHKNIVETIDFGQVHGLYYLVQEYATGKSLLDIFTESGPFKEKILVDILLQVKEALKYLWVEHGIVHRDLTPRNIIFDHKHVKVCDFGLVKKIEAESSKPMVTGTGMLLGTPGYMAPEILTSQKITFCVDLYALGMTLYVLATGKFRTSNSQTKVHNVNLVTQQNFLIESIKKQKPEFSSGFSNFVTKLLDPVPTRRCKSITEFDSDVECVKVGKNPKRLPQRNPYRKVATIFAGVVLVSMFAVGYYVINLQRVKKIEKDIASHREKAKNFMTKHDLSKVNYHFLQALSFATILQNETSDKLQKDIISQWLQLAKQYTTSDNIEGWQRAVACYDYAINIDDSLQVTHYKEQLVQKISAHEEQVREEKQFAKLNFEINRVWLSNSRNSKTKKTTFLTQEKIYLFAEITVHNYLPQYNIFFRYTISEKEYEKKLTAISNERFTVEFKIKNSNKTLKSDIKVALVCRDKIKTATLPIEIKSPISEEIKWAKPKAMFMKDYVKRLSKWKKNQGIWAPDEQSSGVFAIGSGDIVRFINYKKPWRLHGEVKLDEKTREVCVGFSLENKQEFSLSFQPIAGSYLVKVFEDTSKRRNVLKSKVFKGVKTFSYTIENYVRFVRVIVQNEKLCDIPIAKVVNKISLCTKKSSSVYFSNPMWQSSN